MKTPLVMKTILVVADDLLTQRLIQVNLLHQGYNVLQALTGGDVWNQIETQRPDLIVLDMNLPDGEADELLPKLKAEGYGRTLPLIVLMLNEQDNSEWVKWNDEGMRVSEGFKKPIKPLRLMSCVKICLSGKPEEFSHIHLDTPPGNEKDCLSSIICFYLLMTFACLLWRVAAG